MEFQKPEYCQKMQCLFYNINSLMSQFLDDLTNIIKVSGLEYNVGNHYSYLLKILLPIEVQTYVQFWCPPSQFRTLVNQALGPFGKKTKLSRNKNRKSGINQINTQLHAVKNDGFIENKQQGLLKTYLEDKSNFLTSNAHKKIDIIPFKDIFSFYESNTAKNQNSTYLLASDVEIELGDWIIGEVNNKRRVKMSDVVQRAMVLINSDNFKTSKNWTLRFLNKHPRIRQMLKKQAHEFKNNQKKQDEHFTLLKPRLNGQTRSPEESSFSHYECSQVPENQQQPTSEKPLAEQEGVRDCPIDYDPDDDELWCQFPLVPQTKEIKSPAQQQRLKKIQIQDKYSKMLQRIRKSFHDANK